jgi:hypothetical protein
VRDEQIGFRVFRGHEPPSCGCPFYRSVPPCLFARLPGQASSSARPDGAERRPW